MSKFTVQIVDNVSKEIRIIDCDCIFAGFANDDHSEIVSYVRANGMIVSYAQLAALKAIEDYDAKNPMSIVARNLIKQVEAQAEEEKKKSGE